MQAGIGQLVDFSTIPSSTVLTHSFIVGTTTCHYVGAGKGTLFSSWITAVCSIPSISPISGIRFVIFFVELNVDNRFCFWMKLTTPSEKSPVHLSKKSFLKVHAQQKSSTNLDQVHTLRLSVPTTTRMTSSFQFIIFLVASPILSVIRCLILHFHFCLECYLPTRFAPAGVCRRRISVQDQRHFSSINVYFIPWFNEKCYFTLETTEESSVASIIRFLSSLVFKTKHGAFLMSFSSDFLRPLLISLLIAGKGWH